MKQLKSIVSTETLNHQKVSMLRDQLVLKSGRTLRRQLLLMSAQLENGKPTVQSLATICLEIIKPVSLVTMITIQLCLQLVRTKINTMVKMLLKQ